MWPSSKCKSQKNPIENNEEEEEKEKEAPFPPIKPEKKEIENKEEEKLKKNLDNNIIKNEDEAISCDSFDSNSCCAISNKHLNDKYSNSGSYEDNLSCDSYHGREYY